MSEHQHPLRADGFCRVCFTYPNASHGQARRTDPPTSHQAARRVTTGSAKHRLLRAHYLAHVDGEDGLTDEEAASRAALSLVSEYATRCSELTRAGLLVATGATRAGSSGMQREVRHITEAGIREAADR